MNTQIAFLLNDDVIFPSSRMPDQGYKQILNICKKLGALNENRLIVHQPSFTAYEKQKILPNYAIQKTITLSIGNHIFLCSGFFDFNINKTIIKLIATNAKIPFYTNTVKINPEFIDPMKEFGLAKGMVSTFINPKINPKLSGICLLGNRESDKDEVAISLSLRESVLLPSNIFHSVIITYIEDNFPHIKLFDLRK